MERAATEVVAITVASREIGHITNDKSGLITNEIFDAPIVPMSTPTSPSPKVLAAIVPNITPMKRLKTTAEMYCVLMWVEVKPSPFMIVICPRSFVRSIFKNRAMLYAFVFGAVLTLGVVYIPGISTLFGTTALSAAQLVTALSAAFAIVPLYEIYKMSFKAADTYTVSN